MSSTERNGWNNAEHAPSTIPLIEIPPQDGYSQTEDEFLVAALREYNLLSPNYLYAPFSAERLSYLAESAAPIEFFEDTLDCYHYNADDARPALVDSDGGRTAKPFVEYLDYDENDTCYLAVYDRQYLQHVLDTEYQFIDPHTGKAPENLAMTKRAAFLGIVKVTLLDH